MRGPRGAVDAALVQSHQTAIEQQPVPGHLTTRPRVP